MHPHYDFPEIPPREKNETHFLNWACQRLLHKCPMKNSKIPISTQSSSAHVEERLGSLSFSLGVCAAVCGAFALASFFIFFSVFLGGSSLTARFFLYPFTFNWSRGASCHIVSHCFPMNTSCQEGPCQ